MTITNEIKKQIVDGLLDQFKNFSGSETQFATSLGINKAIFNRIKNGDYEKVLSEPKWIVLARRANVSLDGGRKWQIVKTPVFEFITAQLEHCQKNSICSVLCDISDIGKTETTRYYTKNHKNAIYIDCSQAKTKQRLIRSIATAFGVDARGKYFDVYDDLAFYLRSLGVASERPIIILDEAGDLQYDAFLEIKALYNATEYRCSIYMTGADGLKAKWERAINGKKVGYTEIFSRMGKRYQKVVPVDATKREKMLTASASMIIRANATEQNVNIGQMIRKTLGDDQLPSLRRIYNELTKVSA